MVGSIKEEDSTNGVSQCMEYSQTFASLMKEPGNLTSDSGIATGTDTLTFLSSEVRW